MSNAAGLRIDARRNRDALLAAARRVLSGSRLDAPLAAIAREAGLGRATLYRRFPSRDALVGAILESNIDELAWIAEREPDRPRAYFLILAVCVELQRRDQAFIDMLAGRPEAEEIERDLQRRFLAVVEQPLRDAQAAGLVRSDLRPDDTLSIVVMLGAATRPTRNGGPAPRCARALALVLDALVPAPAHRDLDRAGSVHEIVERATEHVRLV